jgi:transposase
MGEANRGVRRRHSGEVKQRILAACDEPGASVARIALAHGINANLLHKWRREVRRGAGGGRAAVVSDPFIPVSLAAPAPVASIRIELRRGATAVSVHWPVSAATECAAWLRDWLK